MFKSAEAANTGLVVSGGGTVLSWVDTIDILIRWGVGAASFCAAVMTFLYYYEKRKRERDK
jgi:hypothetical protein